MRILLITSMVPDRTGIGAIPKLLHAQLVGLRERHDVTLVATFGEDPGQAEAAEELVRSGFDAHCVDRRRSASALRRWRVRADLAAKWATTRWPWRTVNAAAGVQPVLDRATSGRAFDVVAIEDNPMSVLRFPAGVPTVLTEHEAIRAPASEWRAQRLSERPVRALRARDWRRLPPFQVEMWRRFDLVQVFCEGDAAAIREHAPDVAPRIRVNPFGLVLPDAADPTREEPGVVLFTGTFTHLPNRDAAHWLAGEIMPAVRARHPGARLRLIGSSPPREVLDLAGPHVEVLADVPSMTPHLEAASVVIAPVRTGGGMRMKVLEALAKAKAVVTTSRGAEGFTGFEPEPPFAVADDVEGIAIATADLLADESRRRELGIRARGFAKRHHSPAAWAARLETVYEAAREARKSQPETAGHPG